MQHYRDKNYKEPWNKGAASLPGTKIALMLSHIIYVRHSRHGEPSQPIQAHERSTGVICDTVTMDKLISFQITATIARSATNLLIEVE